MHNIILYDPCKCIQTHMLIIGRFVFYISSADICYQTEGPESGSQRDCEFRLRGPGQPTAVGILDARRIPSAHVPRQRVRPFPRHSGGHATHTGCSKRRRRISRLFRVVRRRFGDLEGVPASTYSRDNNRFQDVYL